MFPARASAMLCLPLLLSPLLAAAAPASKGHSNNKRDTTFPFDRVVAFGDNLSDNGNGSYAHGVTAENDPGNKVYGYGTWTNGPVAVSYLVDLLGVPLDIDYAFGHANGGSLFGATIDNSYTQSTADAPDAFTQVQNYTSTSGYSADDVASTLHFVWIGNNDINLYHISTSSTDNSAFADQMSSKMVDLVGKLTDFGAQHIFVPGMYPKQISPSSQFYASDSTQVDNLGNAIKQANTAIQSALEQAYGDKVTYYDAFGFMQNVWDNHDSYGISHVGGEFCDGYSQEDWDLCVTQGHGDEFYWMQYLDMTTRVHQLVAQDMQTALNAKFAA